MKNMQYFAVAVLLYILNRAGSVDAIQCYTCKSENDPGCDSSTPGEQYLKNCSTIHGGPKYIACRKIDNWVDFKMLGQEPTKRIIRQCAADIDESRLCYYRAGFGGRVNVCDCLENNCNSASIPLISVASLFITLIVFLKNVA